jgi:hypothetical protein
MWAKVSGGESMTTNARPDEDISAISAASFVKYGVAVVRFSATRFLQHMMKLRLLHASAKP